MEVAVVFFVVVVGGGGLYRIEGLVAGRGSDDDVDEGINAAGRGARSQLTADWRGPCRVAVDLVALGFEGIDVDRREAEGSRWGGRADKTEAARADGRWTLKLAERNRQHSDGSKSKALDGTMKQMEEVAGSKEEERESWGVSVESAIGAWSRLPLSSG
jgi:hypothetical protein